MAGRGIVVTGAAGFVAAAVVRRLVAQGHRVLAWIRPTTDTWRLSALESERRIDILRLDLRDLAAPAGRKLAEEALTAFEAEIVVHAAWQGIDGPARDNPAQLDNVAPCLNVVHVSAAAGATRLLGLGSQAEYGRHDQPISEDTLTKPTTLYGAAKLACGHLCLALARRLGISAAWARLFSVYGPGAGGGTLIPDLARALREKRPFPLGSGDTLWDYLYEDDAAEALSRLALADSAVGFFNVASGSAVPLREVMLRVGALVAPETRLEFGRRSVSTGDLPRLEADVTRLARATGFQPATSLETGLVRAVEAATGKGQGSGLA